MDGRNEELID